MEKSIKRRGKRGGPTHKLWITMKKPSFEMLEAQSEKLGYSISFLAQQVIDRGLAAGLGVADTPSPNGADVVRVTQMEHYFQLVEELQRVHKERIEGLIEHLDLKDQLIAQMQRGLELYTETITDQARDLQFYQQARVKDVVPGEL